MADDCDDNVLLDSDEEVNVKSKKSKASDFIPKPRILTAPASKIVSIAHSQRTSVDDASKHKDSDDIERSRGQSSLSNSDIDHSRGHSNMKLSSGNFSETNTVRSPKKDSRHGSTSNSNSLPRVVVDVERGISSPPAAIEPSSVHLVNHNVTPPSSAEVKAEEGTYKRLISHSPSVEDQIGSDGVDVVKAEGSCLCRVIKNPTIRRNWKVYLGSIVLTTLGLGLVIFGIILGYLTSYTKDLKYLLFIAGGVLLLIPGSYHLVFMTLAAWGVPGFKFSKLPTLRGLQTV